MSTFLLRTDAVRFAFGKPLQRIKVDRAVAIASLIAPMLTGKSPLIFMPDGLLKPKPDSHVSVYPSKREDLEGWAETTRKFDPEFTRGADQKQMTLFDSEIYTVILYFAREGEEATK